MPSLLKHTDCPACGHRHHFYFTGDDLSPGREYAYVCPETAKKATLRPLSAAEVVHSPPQGAVVLTQAVYDSPPNLGHEVTQGTATGKPFRRARREASRPPPVGPGALPAEVRARGSPSSPAAPPASGLPGIEREVHEIGREVQGLAARVGELAEKVATAPPAATAPSAHTPPSAETNEPEAGPTRLQEVLPEVKDLAGKVGGMKQLSDIVETLKETKK